MPDEIVIFRKADLGKKKMTPKQISAWIDDAIDEGRIRIVRRQVILAVLGGTIAKLPLVSQHEIDKTNGPRKLNEAGKGWVVPIAELGRKGEATDSTVISIKRYIQNAIGIDPAAFSVCRVHGRQAVELSE